MTFRGKFKPCALGAAALAALAAPLAFSTPAFAAETEAPAASAIPVEYYTLDNGLKVVISRDNAVPTTTIGVYYGIGFRLEPRNRTGFAHLFEHMMFQGSENLGKAEFMALVNQVGGVLNGSTRFDFTNYYEIVPSNATETLLWAEADRMKGLKITEENLDNQKGVVKNEVKVNVLNQPYGGWPWLDLPQAANTNWANAHNFYGDLEEIDAATLEDVDQFFKTFYRPNNAVLVVSGDVDVAQVKGWVNKYFAPIPAGEAPPRPDLAEPRQTAEKRIEKVDPLAPQPALAWGYHLPPKGSDELAAFRLIDYILLQGQDSRLSRILVNEKAYTDSVGGGINMLLGNSYDYNGPMLWAGTLIHDADVDNEAILAEIDAQALDLQTNLVSEAELERARIKARSDLYDLIGSGTRFEQVNLLAVLALFDDNPGRINELEDELARVTPEMIRKTAREYLRQGNRTVITLKPGKTAGSGE